MRVLRIYAVSDTVVGRHPIRHADNADKVIEDLPEIPQPHEKEAVALLMPDVDPIFISRVFCIRCTHAKKRLTTRVRGLADPKAVQANSSPSSV